MFNNITVVPLSENNIEAIEMLKKVSMFNGKFLIVPEGNKLKLTNINAKIDVKNGSEFFNPLDYSNSREIFPGDMFVVDGLAFKVHGN